MCNTNVQSLVKGSDKTYFIRLWMGFVGGVFGVIVVRAFLLNEVEKIGFSLVMNNLSNLSGDDFSTVLNSSTFLKCCVGFLVGCAAGELGYRNYMKEKSALPTPSAKTQVPSPTPVTPSGKSSVESRLTELLALKEKNFITAEDYEKKKADIVREL